MKVLVMMKCAVGHDPEVQPWHDKAAEINNLVYSKLAGDYSRNLRSTLLIGYSQAILQYHDAILVLQSHRTLGSAARALHRPLVEAVARAYGFMCKEIRIWNRWKSRTTDTHHSSA
jgi:hypothetical protein